MSHAVAKICAAIEHDDAGVHLDADEMREVIDALDERERAIGRERKRAEAAEAEVAQLRAHLATLLSYEQSTGHSHDWGGHWDSSGGRPVGGKPCLRCHQFADAREAVGLPRWPALPERDEEEATEHRDDCGCGGWRPWR